MKRAWTAVGVWLVAVACLTTGAWADEPPTVVDAARVTHYVELGGLDAADAEKLAALLKREFPKAAVELIDGTLRVQTDATTFAAVEKVLADHRVPAVVVRKMGDRVVVVRGAKDLPPAGIPALDELEVDLAPDALDALRTRLRHVKERLEAADEGGREREELEAVRRRLEEARERLEAAGHALRGGGGRGGKGGRGGPPAPPRPPEVRDGKPFVGEGADRRREGPLAEFRRRIHHLQQAVEHLNAAGFERLAKQAGEGIAQVKHQAAEAEKRRAEEEARAAAMRKEHAAREAAREREREEARAREHAQREAGLRGPRDANEIRSEELVDLVRALNQQVSALREEVKALREQVGRDRPGAR
jgi:hypothetical protein